MVEHEKGSTQDLKKNGSAKSGFFLFKASFKLLPTRLFTAGFITGEIPLSFYSFILSYLSLKVNKHRLPFLSIYKLFRGGKFAFNSKISQFPYTMPRVSCFSNMLELPISKCYLLFCPYFKGFFCVARCFCKFALPFLKIFIKIASFLFIVQVAQILNQKFYTCTK